MDADYVVCLRPRKRMLSLLFADDADVIAFALCEAYRVVDRYPNLSFFYFFHLKFVYSQLPPWLLMRIVFFVL